MQNLQKQCFWRFCIKIYEFLRKNRLLGKKVIFRPPRNGHFPGGSHFPPGKFRKIQKVGSGKGEYLFWTRWVRKTNKKHDWGGLGGPKCRIYFQKMPHLENPTLALSQVDFPTGAGPRGKNNFFRSDTFLGFFDVLNPKKVSKTGLGVSGGPKNGPPGQVPK